MNFSFQALEFEKVLPLLLKYLKTYEGIKYLDNIFVLQDAKLIDEEFALIKQMIEFLKFDGSLHFDEIRDLKISIDNSTKDGFILETGEILEIKKAVNILTTNIGFLQEYSGKYPLLLDIFKNIDIPGDFIQKINRIIDDDGYINDSASEELKKIRKRKSNIRSDIHNKLNNIMDRDDIASSIQDKLVTIRDGRFVIPVKSQSRNKSKSEQRFIVHSFSNSGETAFVEPQEVIGLNNEMIEIDGLEARELTRILRDITSEIGKLSENLKNIILLLGRMEWIYARAKFGIEFHCCTPEITQEPVLKLINAYHPLLGKDSVPISIETGRNWQGIIISGPNAGGKTVALKTSGLLVILGLCAIPIPADNGSKIGVFTEVMAEIGDEQSISENLSSFSGHILGISKMLNECGPNSLVLIDEIAGSTEPKEGEALGREIIRFILETGAKFIITTHYQAIKELGYHDKRIKNGFVEFDEEKMMPLYRLHMDGTGSSYALKAARKYGLNSSIIHNAEKFLLDNASENEIILRSIENDRNLLTKRLKIAEKHMRQTRELKNFYESIQKEINEQKKIIEKKGIELLRNELDETLKEISDLKNQMKKKNPIKLKDADIQIENAREMIKSFEIKALEEERIHPNAIIAGQTVYIGSLHKEGYIEDICGSKVKVRIGIISTLVDEKDIYITNNKNREQWKTTHQISESLSSSSFQLDIRGKSLEEAMKIVEKNIDLSIINGTESFSIIHGKGEGVLRKAVWDYLKDLNSIKKYYYAKPEEGGQGKTIITFK